MKDLARQRSQRRRAKERINMIVTRSAPSEQGFDQTIDALLDARIATAVYLKQQRPFTFKAETYRLFDAFDIATPDGVRASVLRLLERGHVDGLNVRDTLALTIPSPRPLRLRRREIAPERVPGGFYAPMDGRWYPLPDEFISLVLANPVEFGGPPVYKPSWTDPVIRYELHEPGSATPVYEVEATREMYRHDLRVDLVAAIAQAGRVFLDRRSAFVAFVKYVLRYSPNVVYSEIMDLANEGVLEVYDHAGRLAVRARSDVQEMVTAGRAVAATAAASGEISPYIWPEVFEGDGPMQFRRERGRPCVVATPKRHSVLMAVAA